MAFALGRLGFYGLAALEPIVLASPATDEPLFLIGRDGTDAATSALVCAASSRNAVTSSRRAIVSANPSAISSRV